MYHESTVSFSRKQCSSQVALILAAAGTAIFSLAHRAQAG